MRKLSYDDKCMLTEFMKKIFSVVLARSSFPAYFS